jgi:hypothetical protein
MDDDHGSNELKHLRIRERIYIMNAKESIGRNMGTIVGRYLRNEAW